MDEFRLPRAGNRRRDNGNIDNQENVGFYWSSTSYTSPNAYMMNFNSNYIRPQNNEVRGGGFSVRCFKN